jgi:hypothetical protein
MNQSNTDIRINALDYVKGLGIIFFIYWHAISYTYSPGVWATPSGRFVHCATGMFIFIAGVLVGFHYSRKSASGNSSRKVYTRLVIRGLKLIAYFLTGYFLKQFVEQKVLNFQLLETVITNSVSLFYKDRWDLPLQILFVIGSYLISASAALWLESRGWTNIIVTAIVSAFIVEAIIKQPLPYFWHYFLVGLSGEMGGLLMRRHWFALRERLESRFVKIYLPILTVFLIIDLGAAASEFTYQLFLSWTSLNLFSVIMNVLGMGLPFFRKVDIQNRKLYYFSWLSKLGQYSLLVYLVQISILMIGKTVGLFPFGYSYWVPVFIAISLILVCLIVSSLTHIGRKNAQFDYIYRKIFV